VNRLGAPSLFSARLGSPSLFSALTPNAREHTVYIRAHALILRRVYPQICTSVLTDTCNDIHIRTPAQCTHLHQYPRQLFNACCAHYIINTYTRAVRVHAHADGAATPCNETRCRLSENHSTLFRLRQINMFS